MAKTTSKPTQFRLPEELLRKIDARSKELGLTRSAYVKMILTQDTNKLRTDV